MGETLTCFVPKLGWWSTRESNSSVFLLARETTTPCSPVPHRMYRESEEWKVPSLISTSYINHWGRVLVNDNTRKMSGTGSRNRTESFWFRVRWANRYSKPEYHGKTQIFVLDSNQLSFSWREKELSIKRNCCAVSFYNYYIIIIIDFQIILTGDVYGTWTRDLWRDRPAFYSSELIRHSSWRESLS